MRNFEIKGTVYRPKSWKSVMASLAESGFILDKEDRIGGGAYSVVFLDKKNADRVLKVSGCMAFSLFHSLKAANELNLQCNYLGDLSEGFKHYSRVIDYNYAGSLEWVKYSERKEFGATIYKLKKLNPVRARDSRKNYEDSKRLLVCMEVIHPEIRDIYRDFSCKNTSRLFNQAKIKMLELEEFNELELSLRKALFIGLNFIEIAYEAYMLKVLLDKKRTNIMVNPDSGDIILNDIFYSNFSAYAK